jgi:hypothetical protein
MANTFKHATKSDVVTDAVSNSTTNIFTGTAGSSNIILSVYASNKTGSSVTVDLYLVTTTGDDVYLLANAPVPAGSSLELTGGTKIIVEASDILRARCNTATSLDLCVSYLEQT